MKIKETNWSKQLTRWNSTRMKFISIYSMRRKEKILRFFMQSMTSLSQILTSCTTCSKILFMLMTTGRSRKLSLNFHHLTKDQGIKPIFTCLVMILIRKSAYVMMSTKMNGQLKNCRITLRTNSISAQLQLRLVLLRFWSQVVGRLLRKMRESTIH